MHCPHKIKNFVPSPANWSKFCINVCTSLGSGRWEPANLVIRPRPYCYTTNGHCHTYCSNTGLELKGNNQLLSWVTLRHRVYALISSVHSALQSQRRSSPGKSLFFPDLCISIDWGCWENLQCKASHSALSLMAKITHVVSLAFCILFCSLPHG